MQEKILINNVNSLLPNIYIYIFTVYKTIILANSS